MWNQLAGDRETLLWIGAVSLGMFLGSLILLPIVLVRIREDYFMPRAKSEQIPTHWPPALRWTVRILKNLVGVILVLAGVTMLVIPGQGVLTIVVGIALLDFPGKRALVLRLVRLSHVRRAINAVRARYGRPPLRLPERDSSHDVPA